MDLTAISAALDTANQINQNVEIVTTIVTLEIVAKVLLLCLIPLFLVVAGYCFQCENIPKTLSGVFVAATIAIALVAVAMLITMIILRNKLLQLQTKLSGLALLKK
jgi:hypothetical protein